MTGAGQGVVVTEDLERLQLERARSGDPDAFSYLVERYLPRIYGACFGFLGNRQDAEDCAQETFIKAFRAIGDYNFLASFYTWLYRIAVNTCLDYRRKTSRLPAFSLDEALETDDSQVFWQIADETPLPDELAESAEMRQMIHAEIKHLPEYLREILVLRDIEGFSYHELANLLRISEGTVKSRLSRARHQLMLGIQKREQTLIKRRLIDKSE